MRPVRESEGRRALLPSRTCNELEACASLFEGVDVSIGNLECVLGRGGEQQLKPYVFRGPADSPRFLKKYFHAVSLANNHSMDYGPGGMVEMLSLLEREKLPYFGGGLNIKQASSPFVIEIKGQRIAILGFNEFKAADYFPVDPLEWVGWVAIIEIEPSGSVGVEIKTIILDTAGCPKPASPN